ncbi:hypothetical protein [Beggiatoa leptomitoformis]|uniref:YcxB-like protein domain-containing protein n=1 Tax=Beggiatoa leptomitoformis TaxID=288004 RepID=A0A2N9YII2_9GAMM|nr:hypothetical protein [Beggiatoa leptomitoformis]ALG67562.1 hypothetical protein AL038_07425 [Beggiatoa leptomitoformis]AUI70209.1 hypothetical protein BLE401_16890 [Beggiatoa leptomitoformis]
MISYQITVHYNRPIIRYALNQFMLQRIGLFTLIVTGCALILMPLLAIKFHSFTLQMFAFGLWMGVGLWGIIYGIRLRQSELILSKMSTPTADITFNESSVTVESCLGKSELRWLAFDEILKFEHAWLLIYARSGYINIPVTEMSPELQQFIEYCFNNYR